MGILWRSAVAGLLVMGVVGIGAESAASTHWRTPPPARISKSITTQRITFTSTPPNPAVVGGTYRPRARGGASGNPVTFSIDPSAQGSCTISGDRVSFVAVGTCVIDANQAGSPSYEAATQVQQSFELDPGTQTITFTSTPPNLAVVGDTYTPTATGGGSGNPVTFSIDPSANGSCSISGTTVTFVAVGTCVIDANQAGSASYEAATQVQQSFDPDSGTQSITFTSTPPSPAVTGGTYQVRASGGASGNPLTFSVDPSAHGSCSTSGATVTLVAVGTCVIDANQAGNASYEAATQVQQSFAVLGTQSITFTSTPPKPAVVGGTYPVRASGGASGNPVTFSVDPSAHGSCSISGATVTLVAGGTCVIDANQAGNASYEAATQVQQSFAVVGTQSITFTSTPPKSAVVGGTYTPTATGGASGNPVTFSVDSSANGSCSLSGATVTLVAVGTCVLDANQAGNASYEAATQVQQSFAVGASSGSTPPPSGTACVVTSNGSEDTDCPFGPNAQITGSGISGDPYVDPNVWSPTAGFSETLTAYSPTDWSVNATAPAGNDGVIAFTNTGVDTTGAVDSYASTISSFSETMPHNSQTSAWSMYDLWFNNWADEVMIQYDFSGNGSCDSVATAQFGGTDGVPLQTWHLCDFSGGGSTTLDWKLGASDPATSESSGSINIEQMLEWLEHNAPAGSSTTYLPAGSTWTAASQGWEICSTGGQPETFSESDYSLTFTP